MQAVHQSASQLASQGTSSAAQFEIHNSVVAARSQKYHNRLANAHIKVTRDLAPLPEGFRLIIHNTVPQFTWGGWLPPARLVRETRASLEYNMGAVHYPQEKYLQLALLGTRRTGLLISESFPDFIKRAHLLAHEKVEQLRYLRHLDDDDRCRLVCGKTHYLLKDKGIKVQGQAALQHPSYLSVYPTLPVIFVAAGETKNTLGILENWDCHGGSLLPSIEERLKNSDHAENTRFRSEDPIACAEQPAVTFFDRTPVLIFPSIEKSCSFVLAEHPNVYRTPRLYNLKPDKMLSAALQNYLRDNFAIFLGRP